VAIHANSVPCHLLIAIHMDCPAGLPRYCSTITATGSAPAAPTRSWAPWPRRRTCPTISPATSCDTASDHTHRQGHDLVLVAELMGHKRLDQTRRYSLPTQADRERAIASLPTDR